MRPISGEVNSAGIHCKSQQFIILPCSSRHRTISICISSFAFFQTMYKSPFIHISRFPVVSALAIRFILFPFTHIAISVGIGHFAMTVYFIELKVSFETSSFYVFHCSITMPCPLMKSSMVNGSVFCIDRSLHDLVCFPISNSYVSFSSFSYTTAMFLVMSVYFTIIREFIREYVYSISKKRGVRPVIMMNKLLEIFSLCFSHSLNSK